MSTLYQVSVALMKTFEPAILQLDSFEDILSFVQKGIPAQLQDQERLLYLALSLGITDSRLAELDLEYAAIQRQALTYGNDDPELNRLFQIDPVLADIRDMLTQQRMECQEAVRGRDMLQQQVNHGKSALSSLRSENDACHLTIAQLTRANAAMTSRAKVLEAEKEDLALQLAELKEKLRDLEERNMGNGEAPPSAQGSPMRRMARRLSDL